MPDTSGLNVDDYPAPLAPDDLADSVLGAGLDTGADAGGEDDFDDEIDGADDSGTTSTAGRGGARKTAASRGVSRAVIRRVAAKAEEVVEAPQQVLDLAAALLGTSTGVADLTTAIMTADRGAAAPLGDIRDLAKAADESQMEALIAAVEMGRERMKAVWGVLASLGLVSDSTPLPPSDAKAGGRIVEAISTADKAAFTSLDDVVSLLRKSRGGK